MNDLFIADQQINAGKHDERFQQEYYESDVWDVRVRDMFWDQFATWHYGC